MLIAEREGFEPPVPLSTAVFKTAVIDHSTISPNYSYGTGFGLKAVQSYNNYFIWQKYSQLLFFLLP